MRSRAGLLALVGVFVLLTAGGCSQLALGIEGTEPAWNDQQALRQKREMQQQKEAREENLQKWRDLHEIPPEAYTLGPRDRLFIRVRGLEDPEATSNMYRSERREMTLPWASFDRTINDSGRISLPWIGTISLSGLSVEEAEDSILEAYKGKYIAKPRVMINLEERLSKPVVVTGAVRKPGVYYLETNQGTVLEALALAGGVDEREAGNQVVISHAGAKSQLLARSGVAAQDGSKLMVKLSLDELQGANPEVNLPVSAGDMVVVSSTKRYVQVLGYVNRPGSYDIRRGERMGLMKALARAGGPSKMGRASNVYLARAGSENGRKVIPVDLEAVASGQLPEPVLKDGDALVIGTGAMARVGEFLAPATNISANASVSPQ